MRRKLERKVYCADLGKAAALCREAGGDPAEPARQLDLCFHTERGHLALRQEAGAAQLLRSERLDSPLLCEAARETVEVAAPEALARTLEGALGLKARIEKQRRSWLFEGGKARVHLDAVDGLGSFLALEVDVERARGEPTARALGEKLAERLQILPQDALAYTYADLVVMTDAAARYRRRLAAVEGAGRMLILDGASCSGKTTLAHWLLEQRELDLHLVPRYATRDPRPGEVEASEYLFTSIEELHRLRTHGALIEHRDFEFGMSYGLPWQAAVDTLARGRHGLGIMNLGNVRHVKRVFPEAVTILVHAPVEVIRRRLVARGMNEEHHIRERLGNARLVSSYRGFYDHVVDNDDGDLEEAQRQLVEIVRG